MAEKSDENNPVLLEIGKILKPHGLDGELIVDLSTNRNERLNSGSVISTPVSYTHLTLPTILLV